MEASGWNGPQYRGAGRVNRRRELTRFRQRRTILEDLDTAMAHSPSLAASLACEAKPCPHRAASAETATPAPPEIVQRTPGSRVGVSNMRTPHAHVATENAATVTNAATNHLLSCLTLIPFNPVAL